MKIPCPIDGCPRTRPAQHAMCSTHWRQVPPDLQREVYKAWRERCRGYDGAVKRHLQALEDAEAAVEGREPRDLFADAEERLDAMQARVAGDVAQLGCSGCGASAGERCRLAEPWNPPDRVCDRQAAQAAQVQQVETVPGASLHGPQIVKRPGLVKIAGMLRFKDPEAAADRLGRGERTPDEAAAALRELAAAEPHLVRAHG